MQDLMSELGASMAEWSRVTDDAVDAVRYWFDAWLQPVLEGACPWDGTMCGYADGFTGCPKCGRQFRVITDETGHLTLEWAWP